METFEEHIKLEKYPVYKDSGVEWLGEIPSHWEVSRLKNLVEMITGFPFKSEKYTESGVKLARGINVKEGVFNWDETRCWPTVESHLKGYLLAEGDILIAMDGSKVGKNFCKVKSADLPILLLQRVARLRARSNLESNYLFNHVLNRNFLLWVEMSKTDPMVPHIAPSDIDNFLITVPPLLEQTAIAAFLDRKTALIDQAIDIKQKQIELLKEHRQILIHKAVTRGLNPNVKMKDSGVEWIGEIPEHWEVKRLKHLGNSIIGLTYNPNDLCGIEEGTLVLRSSNLFEGKFKYGEKENAYVKSRIPQKLLIRENDILICSRNGSRDLIGKCALATKVDAGHSFGAFTTVFRSDINPYIFCILNSSIFKALSGMFLTSTINQLTIGNLNSIEVPIPLKSEMDEIRLCVENINEKVDTAISLKEQEIEKLKEYKATLINSAVTGKIKVG